MTGGINKTQVKRGIMAHQNGTRTAMRFYRFAYRFENRFQADGLWHGKTKRMIGIDPNKIQRLFIKISALKGNYMTKMRFMALP